MQDIPPNWIISFLGVYKELMNFFVVFKFFSEYQRCFPVYAEKTPKTRGLLEKLVVPQQSRNSTNFVERPKVHYPFHNNLRFFSNLSQINPVHATQTYFLKNDFNPLTPNDLYMSRTAPLTSKRFILYIYSTNVGTDYFKHALYSPFFLFKMQFVS